MANQTVTTVLNYDDPSILGLENGENIAINAGRVTVNADVRWNQQAAVMGAVTLSSTLGGSFVIDGTQVWEVPFSASTGNVPTQGDLGANGVTGGTSGATGELTRVWATGSLNPAAAGGAMPATGFIKLRSKTGAFQNGETITLPGGATITASGAGKRSWIHVAALESALLTVPRLGNCSITGDWHELGTTNGLDDQTIQFPVADECPALQVETAPGSGVYEWWLNAGKKWVGQIQQEPAVNGVTYTFNIATRPAYSDPAGFLATARRIRETATTAVHIADQSYGINQLDTGIYTFRTYVAKDTTTRRHCFIGVRSGLNASDRYGIIIDFDAGGAVVNTLTAGTPLNTSNTVTAIGGGWYLVELTINYTSLQHTLGASIGPSDSATPALSNAIPLYAGNTGQGVWFTEFQLIAPSTTQFVNSTDERGKYFFSNPQTGSIIFAQRTGRTAGLKPASGCRIRIPNVILSNAPAIDYTINSLHQLGVASTGVELRYGLSTGASGAVSISHAVVNWYRGLTNPLTVNVQNSALCGWQTSNASGLQTYSNLGIGLSRDNISSGFLLISSALFGTTVTDVRLVRDRFDSTGLLVTLSADVTLTRVRQEHYGFSQGRTGRAQEATNATTMGIRVTNSDNVVGDDCTVIGSMFTIDGSTRVKLLNCKYAERIIGQTVPSDAGTAVLVSFNCTDILIDGFSFVSGLTNVHPYNRIFAANSNVRRLVIQNVGTLAAPINCGSANQTRNLVGFTSTVFDSRVQRVYGQNVATNAMAHNSTNRNIRLYNLWGDAADAMTAVAGYDVLAQGCRWSNNNNAITGAYGVHWEDAFTGTLSGRLTIFGNEPLTSTSDQCSTSLGAGAGFTAAGSIAMPNVNDSATWTMPYFALGHTGIAQFTYGASTTERWLMTGTNGHNFEFEYQIDTGNGFSGWKFLFAAPLQSSGGTSGTNTITLTAAHVDALTRKPQIGDLVATPNARLPAGTTITDVTGASNNVLTLSTNFTSTMSAAEGLFFWKDIAAETISPTTGYRLKVKTRVTIAATDNLFSFLRIPFDTTSTAQQTQYPFPFDATGTISNLLSGSRVQIYNLATATELLNTTALGTSVPYLYYNNTQVSTGNTLRIRVSKLGYEPTTLIAIATASGFAAAANQQQDLIYNDNGIDGSAVTEFVPDYPNVQMDINDPDGETTVQRIYAWLRYVETTQDGIRNWFDIVRPTDDVNYEIDSSVINLKIDNTSASPVKITGGRIYRSDGATVIAATSGSIQMDPARVYALGGIPSLPQIVEGLKPSLSIINDGVKKSSLLVPHTDSLP
jgi:hypothetical protein